jgi:hypothetical protein
VAVTLILRGKHTELHCEYSGAHLIVTWNISMASITIRETVAVDAVTEVSDTSKMNGTELLGLKTLWSRVMSSRTMQMVRWPLEYI